MVSIRKAFAYTLLFLSCLAWALLPVVPFVDASLEQKSWWAGSLFLFAEISWWAAMPFLGPELLQWWQKLKIWWANYRNQK